MKAFLSQRYGPPETLRFSDVRKPAPGPNEVLVKVLAASVNPADYRCLRGRPLFSRVALGLLRPKSPIPGGDIAGKVEEVGIGVTGFRPGDEVYANLHDHGSGGFAEYVSVPVDVLAFKPVNLSFEEAAAVPMAGLTALQGLRYHGGIEEGQKVLVNGASGGVGHLAVQIARSFGAEVTGVASTRKLDFVRSLGVDRVVNYESEDFTRSDHRWDLIVDTVGNRSVSELRRVLASGGRCAVIGFTTMGKLLDVALRGGREISMVMARAAAGDLDRLRDLIESGRIRPVIDRRYPFVELPEAIRYVEEGRPWGKVVIGSVDAV